MEIKTQETVTNRFAANFFITDYCWHMLTADFGAERESLRSKVKVIRRTILEGGRSKRIFLEFETQETVTNRFAANFLITDYCWHMLTADFGAERESLRSRFR